MAKGQSAGGIAGGSSQGLDWSSFFSEANIPMIGYDVASDSIIIIKASDYSVDSDADILHFDIKTGSWAKGDTKFTTNGDKTNFVINSLGELVVAESHSAGAFLKWDSSPKVSATMAIKSKAFDMGNPALIKKIYKIIVEYKGTSASNVNVTVEYDQNGTDVAIGSLSNSSTYIVTELTVAAPTACRNVSVKFATSGSPGINFEISGYNLLYRAKQPR
jgi:hypothetical protein